MNWIQKFCHRCFGWQYVIIRSGNGSFSVRRARLMFGVYTFTWGKGFSFRKPAERQMLLKEAMASSPEELMMTVLKAYTLGPSLATERHIDKSWCALTGDVTTHTLMLPDAEVPAEDVFHHGKSSVTAGFSPAITKPIARGHSHVPKITPGHVFRVNAPPTYQHNPTAAKNQQTDPKHNQ